MPCESTLTTREKNEALFDFGLLAFLRQNAKR